MIAFSTSNVVLLYYLSYVVPVLGVILLIVLSLGISRHTRKKTWWKWTTLAVLLGGLPAVLSVAAYEIGEMRTHADNQRIVKWTRHLVHEETIEGVSFPAGTDVIQDANTPHSLRSATIHGTTTVKGLPLTGNATFEHQETLVPMFVSKGTLAEPARVMGVPCAGRAFEQGFRRDADEGDIIVPNHVVCTLSENYPINRFTFKAGERIFFVFNNSAHVLAEDHLEGTLGKPFEYHGVTLPTGTKMESGEWYPVSAEIDRGQKDHKILEVPWTTAPETGCDEPHPCTVSSIPSYLMEGDAGFTLPETASISFSGLRVKGACKVYLGRGRFRAIRRSDECREIRDAQGNAHVNARYDFSTRAWSWNDDNTSAEY